MAFVTETETYETGIRQLEITDQVLGGANQVANTQAIQLANRTKYLKAHVDDIELNPNKYRALIPISATTTLTSTAYGALIIVSGNTGNIVLTLPGSATADNLKKISIVNKSAYTVTIQAAGADTVDGSANIVLSGINDWVKLVLDFANTKFIIESLFSTVSKVNLEFANNSQADSSGSYVDMTTLTYTTAKTTKYKVTLFANPLSVKTNAGSPPLNEQIGAAFRIYNDTDAAVIDEKQVQNRILWDMSGAAATTLNVTGQWSVVCSRTLTIATGKVIKCQFKTINGTTTSTNNYFTVEEI